MSFWILKNLWKYELSGKTSFGMCIFIFCYVFGCRSCKINPVTLSCVVPCPVSAFAYIFWDVFCFLSICLTIQLTRLLHNFILNPSISSSNQLCLKCHRTIEYFSFIIFSFFKIRICVNNGVPEKKKFRRLQIRKETKCFLSKRHSSLKRTI